MITCSKSDISKPHYLPDFSTLAMHSLHVTLLYDHTPKDFKTTTKNTKWMLAMTEEMDDLKQNNT